jgi:tetratricopeptide (TPR) repeat protein
VADRPNDSTPTNSGLADDAGRLRGHRRVWRALEIVPADATCHNDIGIAPLRGNSAEGVAHLRRAVAINRDFTQAHRNLGNALYLQSDHAAALEQWREVLRREPNDFTVLNQVAWVHATSPDAALRTGAAAVELAAKAVRLSGGAPEFLDTLSAVYAEAGNFPEAVATAERARAMAVTTAKTKLAEGLKTRLALYRKATFREGAR